MIKHLIRPSLCFKNFTCFHPVNTIINELKDEMLGDTKEIIKSRKPKDRQYNGHKKTLHIKFKIEQHEPHTSKGVVKCLITEEIQGQFSAL